MEKLDVELGERLEEEIEPERREAARRQKIAEQNRRASERMMGLMSR
jgi:hypothetical protein